ncbi:MAG: hypothetical protein V3V99_00915 [candidate division Zixibacteria bacterium]
MNHQIKTSGIIIGTLALIFLSVVPASALRLEKSYSILLEENSRVMGSMRDNYLVYSRPDIRMYNIRGREIFSRRLKNNVKPTISPNGEHLGLITYADNSPTSLQTIKLELFDRNGKYQWAINKPAPNDFILTNSGKIFGIEGVLGISPVRVYLYSEYGDLVNILTFEDDYKGIEIAPSGNKFVIDRSYNGYFVYDSTGNLLKNIPECTKFVFDRDDRYFGVFFQKYFHLYQDEKEIIAIETEEFEIKDMVMNVEANVLVLLSKNLIEVYELTSGKQLWKYRFAEKDNQFTVLDLSDDGEYLVCGLDKSKGIEVPKEERHIEGEIYLIPTNGKTLFRQRAQYKDWSPDFPKGFFGSGNRSVYLLTKEELTKYRIN